MLSKTISSIRISGLAALALATACGGDDEPSANPGNGGFDSAVTTPQNDAGTSGTVADAGQCIVTQFGSGVPCALPGSPIGGYRMCVNGVPQGECMSFLGGDSGVDIDAAIGAIRDSGLFADTGLSFNDGSISFGDATIPLPEAGTLKCPTGYMCSSTLGAFFPGISACVKEGGDGLFPDSCTTPNGACMTGTSRGTCQNVVIGNFCITPCN